MIDVVIKISQKFCPEPLYKILGRFIGSNSYFNEDTYRRIAEGYLKAIGGKALQGAQVMEIGSGDQIVTAGQFLGNGARKVICVDPKLDSNNNSQEQIVVETESFDYKIARKYIGAIDVVLSYQVLEHAEDLNNIFKCVWLVLRKGGIFYSKVDLSDHSYHSLGKLMQKYGIDIEKFRGKYLEYSDTSFKLINPNNKIPMNRRLLPEYLQLLDYYGFEWELDERILYHSNKINPAILARIPAQFSHYSAAYWFGIKAQKP